MESSILALIITAIIAIPLSFFYVIPYFFGAPYEKSSNKRIKTIIEFSRGSRKAAELGSGAGHIAIKLAKEGINVDCFEINPFLVLYTKWKVKKLGLGKKIKITWGNFFDYNLGKYDEIVFFQFSTIMNRLEKKFKKEISPNIKVISNYWKLPNVKPIKEKNRVYLYRINSTKLKN